MAVAIPIISGALGIFSTAKSLFSKPKAPAQIAAQTAPTVASASDTAAKEVDKRRRASLLNGGQTDITQGTGSVQNANVGAKELVGQ